MVFIGYLQFLFNVIVLISVVRVFHMVTAMLYCDYDIFDILIFCYNN